MEKYAIEESTRKGKPAFTVIRKLPNGWVYASDTLYDQKEAEARRDTLQKNADKKGKE